MARARTDTPLAETAAQLRLAITRTSRRLRQEALRKEAGGEMSPSTTAALASVERHGPLTPSELADTERVRRPTATRILRTLEEAGLVERTPDPEDGRSALISITAGGREKLRSLRKRKTAYLARRMRDLDADEVATLRGAAQILERLLETDRDAAPRRERA